ncbi:unnamed protein product [Protopolystoma xenopodis]|uniref:Uncharacterized protein n=1 Tax=Protopolystoma xenopodis TaxID=117903 RepID=A0A448X4U8_9PLAT|nr:unnamed protein product [Protopolystoma xenopodis]
MAAIADPAPTPGPNHTRDCAGATPPRLAQVFGRLADVECCQQELDQLEELTRICLNNGRPREAMEKSIPAMKNRWQKAESYPKVDMPTVMRCIHPISCMIVDCHSNYFVASSTIPPRNVILENAWPSSKCTSALWPSRQRVDNTRSADMVRVPRGRDCSPLQLG